MINIATCASELHIPRIGSRQGPGGTSIATKDCIDPCCPAGNGAADSASIARAEVESIFSSATGDVFKLAKGNKRACIQGTRVSTGNNPIRIFIFTKQRRINLRTANKVIHTGDTCSTQPDLDNACANRGKTHGVAACTGEHLNTLKALNVFN